MRTACRLSQLIERLPVHQALANIERSVYSVQWIEEGVRVELVVEQRCPPSSRGTIMDWLKNSNIIDKDTESEEQSPTTTQPRYGTGSTLRALTPLSIDSFDILFARVQVQVQLFYYLYLYKYLGILLLLPPPPPPCLASPPQCLFVVVQLFGCLALFFCRFLLSLFVCDT